MRPVQVAGVLLLICVLVSSCAQPELTRRYKEVGQQPPAMPTKVSLYADVVAVEPRSSKKVAEVVGVRAQEKIFESMFAATGGDIEKSVDLLLKPLSERSEPKTNFAKFSKRIVTIIDADFASPADRIENADVKLSLAGHGVRGFGPIKQWATTFQTVNFGTLGLKQERELKSETEVLPKNTIVEAVNLTGRITSTLSEEISLSREIPHLTISRAPNRMDMHLRHRGALGLSLEGTTAIDVAIDVRTAKKILAFFDESVIGAKPKENLRFRNVTYPDSACSPIELTASLEADVRRVLEGKDTYTESDDVIFPERVKLPPAAQTKLTLLSKSTLEFHTWTLVEIRSSGSYGSVLDVVDPDGSAISLAFVRQQDAYSALAWLRTKKPAQLDGRHLYLGNPALGGRRLAAGDSAYATIGVKRDTINTISCSP